MLFGKYLKKYYKKYAFFLIVGVLVLILIDWVQLYIPEYLGRIVSYLQDGSVTSEELGLIGKTVGYVLIVAAIMSLGRVLFRLVIFHASYGIEAGLRREMFEKAERLSQRYYHENKVGTIMSWFSSDLETIEECFGWGTVMLVDAFFLSILTIYKMFSLEIALSCIAIIPIVLIVIWGALVEKFMGKKWKERQEAFDSLYDYAQENFTGIRVIKAFVKENQEIHQFAKVARQNENVNIQFVKISVLFDVLIEIIISLVLSIILGFGGWFTYACVTGNPVVIFNQSISMSADKLVVFTGYFDTLVWPAIALGNIITMRARGKASMKRVSNFLDQNEEIKNIENPIVLDGCKGEITFNNFSFNYPSSNDEVISNVSLTIKPGEAVGIIGKIGSGKSTLVQALLRLYNIAPNSILIDGNDIMDCDIESVRKHIAYVPQDNFLFSDSIKNNINFSDIDISIEDTISAAEFADVHDNIMDFKNKYETVMGERGVTLSGGQKQRISIARAYVKNSAIMILDDSVSAVDIKTEQKILNNIKELRKEKTTIVISSRVSTVNQLDKVIVLKNGELEAFDTPSNLLKTSETFKKMTYLQKLEKEVEGK